MLFWNAFIAGWQINGVRHDYTNNADMSFKVPVKNFWHLRLFIITVFLIIMKDEGQKFLN